MEWQSALWVAIYSAGVNNERTGTCPPQRRPSADLIVTNSSPGLPAKKSNIVKSRLLSSGVQKGDPATQEAPGLIWVTKFVNGVSVSLNRLLNCSCVKIGLYTASIYSIVPLRFDINMVNGHCSILEDSKATDKKGGRYIICEH